MFKRMISAQFILYIDHLDITKGMTFIITIYYYNLCSFVYHVGTLRQCDHGIFVKVSLQRRLDCY